MSSAHKIHRAWIIAAAGVLIYLCNSGIPANVLPLYIPYMEDMGYSGTQTSMLISIRCCVSFIGTFLAPWFYKKLKLRASIVLGVLLVVAAELTIAFSTGYAGIVIGTCLLGFSHGAFGIVVVSILIARWFDKKRGTAQGMASTGTGLSTLIFPLIVTSVAASFSFRRAVLTVSAIAALFGLIIFLAIRSDPEDVGLKPYGFGEAEVPSAKKRSRSLGIDLGKKLNLFFFLSCLLLGAASMASYSHYSILFTTTGHSRDLVSKALSFSGIVLIGSKFGFGALVDKIGLKKTSFLSMAILIFGTILCLFGEGRSWMPFAALGISNLGYPPISVGLSMWAEEFATPERYPAMMRQNQMAYSLGGLLFSSFPGRIYDAVGSYEPAYAILAGMFALFTLMLAFLYHRTGKLAAEKLPAPVASGRL